MYDKTDQRPPDFRQNTNTPNFRDFTVLGYLRAL